MSPPPPTATNVLTILSEENLKTLRQNFSAKDFADAPKAALGGMYAPARGWVDPFVDRFFILNPVLTPDRREQVIISTFVAHQVPAAYLAVHVYAGLMAGLTVEQLAETILLAGEYCGVPFFNQALTTLQQTLEVLQKNASAGMNETNDVVKMLFQTFA